MSNQSCKDARSKRFNAVVPQSRGLSSAAVVLAGALLLAACGGNVIRQGHLFQEEDLAQVRPGMSKDQVVLALGTPDTQSATSGGVYYYISTTQEQPMAFMSPKVVDRRVVAIYFNNKDRVEQIANYGLKDGKVFDFISRETPSYGRDQGILKEIFRNIGAGPSIPGVAR
ncbi:MAG: outer membrane protein assembly factor BamE [Rhodomicrobium sp.]|nr:outer membrane protein assembly factor BamE [Rhodomicrobium sp.]